MTKPLHVPKTGCSTCPYRKDTPAGVWHPDEYAKLKRYDEHDYLRDGPSAEPQIPELRVFHCHQENATGDPTVCRGWLSVHRSAVAVRLACATGDLRVSDLPMAAEPLYYETGAQAAAAGLSGCVAPDSKAKRCIDSLERRGVGR